MSLISTGQGGQHYPAKPFEFEIRQFIFTREPSAGELAELVWENGLNDHQLTIEKEFIQGNTAFGVNNYRWVANFRKRVNA